MILVRRDDRGAYAVLYALLIVLFIALAGLLVDVSSVRADRRTAKSAADSGAVAGAASLGILSPAPRQACIHAVRFTAASLGISSGYSVSGCDSFPLISSCTATTTMLAPVEVILPKDWRVKVYWPVTDDSGLIRHPTLENWNGRVVQEASTGDGGACSRVGVELDRTRGLVLGSALGLKLPGGGRSQRSVALAEIRPGDGKIVAPLIVLDETSCNALEVSGNGGVIIKANGENPGIIAVDSIADGDSCNADGNNGKAIVVSGTNGFIRAEDSATGAKGVILSYALPDNLPTAYYGRDTADNCQPTPGTFAPTDIRLCPRPEPEGVRFGRGAFDYRYNCQVSCPATTHGDFIDQFKRYVGIDPATNSYSPGPRVPAATPVSTCNFAASYTTNMHFFCANPAGNPDTITVGGTTIFDGGTSGSVVRIDAKKLTVNGTLVFNASQVTLNVEQVDVGAGGCLVFNQPAGVTLSDLCAARTDANPEDPAGYPVSADMPPIFIRGELKVSSGGSFVARQTFIMQPADAAPLAGTLNVATNGRVYWSAPFGKDAIPTNRCTKAVTSSNFPTSGCFEDLASWNEWDRCTSPPMVENVLNGQSGIYVDGTWFIPSCEFVFGGGSRQFQTRAQFVTKRLNLNGQGTLIMSPDADRATETPFVAGALIR